MNKNVSQIYSEVYQILNLLGDEYISKLPNKLSTMLKEKRDLNYNPEYTDEIPIYEQNVKKETMAIIVLLYLNYWCKDENEKQVVKNILQKNEEEYQANLREKYNPDKIFENNLSKNEETNPKEETAIIPYKESIFIKLLNKLKKIINIK